MQKLLKNKNTLMSKYFNKNVCNAVCDEIHRTVSTVCPCSMEWFRIDKQPFYNIQATEHKHKHMRNPLPSLEDREDKRLSRRGGREGTGN